MLPLSYEDFYLFLFSFTTHAVVNASSNIVSYFIEYFRITAFQPSEYLRSGGEAVERAAAAAIPVARTRTQ